MLGDADNLSNGSVRPAGESRHLGHKGLADSDIIRSFWSGSLDEPEAHHIEETFRGAIFISDIEEFPVVTRKGNIIAGS